MTVWIVFIVVIIAFLMLDLGVFNREAHIISVKEASVWTSVWVSLALLFFAFWSITFIQKDG
jgi:tellurite resistance protein TerC